MDIGFWSREFPAAITVCDRAGTVLAMNDRAAEMFAKSGGKDLIGRTILDCHPGEARRKLEHMLANQTTNVYTIEKNGIKKLIYQAPWHEEGEYRGLVEIALELPGELPHFIRS